MCVWKKKDRAIGTRGNVIRTLRRESSSRGGKEGKDESALSSARSFHGLEKGNLVRFRVKNFISIRLLELPPLIGRLTPLVIWSSSSSSLQSEWKKRKREKDNEWVGREVAKERWKTREEKGGSFQIVSKEKTFDGQLDGAIREKRTSRSHNRTHRTSFLRSQYIKILEVKIQ